MLSTACYSNVDGSLWAVWQRDPSIWQKGCAPLIIVLLSKASSHSKWFTLGPWHSSHTLGKTFEVIRVCKCLELSCFCQPPFIFFSSVHVCLKSWQHVLYLALADLMFLLSMLFMARWQLLISSSSSLLFPSNQSLHFLTEVLSYSFDTLYMIDLKVFHFSAIAPAGISANLFSKVFRSSLPVDLDWVGCKLLSVLVLCLTCSLLVDLIITWSVLQLAPLIALVLRKFGISAVTCSCSWWGASIWILGASRSSVDLLVFEVSVGND